jgi:hypothetical protein
MSTSERYKGFVYIWCLRLLFFSRNAIIYNHLSTKLSFFKWSDTLLLDNLAATMYASNIHSVLYRFTVAAAG